ncbi:Uncharacterized protein pbN1_16660 [Aromatoleum bremense]|nr:Uncharacterized protein pbN1_16660 [Aromatoleum bremense]
MGIDEAQTRTWAYHSPAGSALATSESRQMFCWSIKII